HHFLLCINMRRRRRSLYRAAYKHSVKYLRTFAPVFLVFSIVNSKKRNTEFAEAHREPCRSQSRLQIHLRTQLRVSATKYSRRLPFAITQGKQITDHQSWVIRW